MVNLITGLLAMALIVVFLGNYAVKLGSIPLWVIIVAVLVMVVADFYQSAREKNNQTDN